jgi:hypothetical protein
VVLHVEDNETSRNSKSQGTRRFEMVRAQHLKLVKKLGGAALVLGALVTSGKAQDAYQGRFTSSEHSLELS